MVSIGKRAAVLLICISLLLSLVGCGSGGEEIKREGIMIEDDAPYSEAAKEYAGEVIEELILYGYKKSVTQNVSEAKAAELSSLSARVLALTADTSLSEAQYLYLFDTLSKHGQGVVDELVALRRGETSSLTKSEELYSLLGGVLGADTVGSLLYDICLLRCDMRIEKLKARYEEHGFSYLLLDIAAAEDDARVLRECIGRDAFAAVMKNAVALVSLMREGTESVGSFSDGELLVILSHLEIGNISIGSEGWELLFSMITPSGTDTYRAKILNALKSSGDIEKFAAVSDDTVAFIALLNTRLTKDDIAKIRDGRGAAAIGRIFTSLDEEELLLFKKITETEINNALYSELALAEYGEDYEEYLSSIKEVSYGELTESIGTDSFSDNLDNYLRCRFGALYYEVSR